MLKGDKVIMHLKFYSKLAPRSAMNTVNTETNNKIHQLLVMVYVSHHSQTHS